MRISCLANDISEGGEYDENMGKNTMPLRERDRYQVIW